MTCSCGLGLLPVLAGSACAAEVEGFLVACRFGILPDCTLSMLCQFLDGSVWCGKIWYVVSMCHPILLEACAACCQF